MQENPDGQQESTTDERTLLGAGTSAPTPELYPESRIEEFERENAVSLELLAKVDQTVADRRPS